MKPPSVDIKDILAGESSLSLIFATDLFISSMPPEPDLCVCIYDTGGESRDANIVYERPTVQIRIRGAKGRYEEAFVLAQEIIDTLHALNNYTINAARYICIWIVGDIMSVGYDDNHRPLLTVNFRMHRTDA